LLRELHSKRGRKRRRKKKIKNIKKFFFLPYVCMQIMRSGNSIPSAEENEGGRKKKDTGLKALGDCQKERLGRRCQEK
jgi:hypothetical protein